MQPVCSACHSHECFQYSKATGADTKNLVFKIIVTFLNPLVPHWVAVTDEGLVSRGCAVLWYSGNAKVFFVRLCYHLILSFC